LRSIHKKKQAHGLLVESGQLTKKINFPVASELLMALKDIMNGIGLVSSTRSLQSALMQISRLNDHIRSREVLSTQEEYELRNMIIAGELVIRQSLDRKMNRGVFYNPDLAENNSMGKQFHNDYNPLEL
jgi:aspartate oxidase